MDNIVINIWLFIGMPLFMGTACIFMDNPKGDGRNNGAGYRTKRSRQSPENWNTANRTFGYCAYGITLIDIIVLIIERKILIPQKLLQGEQIFFINLGIMFAGIFIGIIITEIRLRKKNKNLH